MISKLMTVIDNILICYKDGENYQRLLEAKEKYFKITGKLNDDDDDYEHRMTCFNEWFVYHHVLPSGEKVYEKFFSSNKDENSFSDAFSKINFSLFSFAKTNFSKQIVLKDILHDKKVILPKDHHLVGIYQDDLFLGRTLFLDGKNYLMRGKRLVPNSLLSILKKQCKKVRRQSDPTLELPFLLDLEALLTKSKRYSHIEPSKIFIF